MNKIEIIPLNVSIDDAEEVSYFYSNNNLILKITNWEFKIIHIHFIGVIKFIDWQKPDQISSFCQSNEDRNLKKYTLLDKFESPCYEVICTDLQFEIFEDEIKYKMKNMDLGERYAQST